MKKKYYFAYGSNCNLNQMKYRCPAARVVEPVTLPNYRLTFNGKANGTGVANIRRRKGSEVKGLLWEITDRCEHSLDIYEGFPTLYEKKNVTVYKGDGASEKAMVYVMTKEYNDHVAPPTDFYLNGIVEGFLQNGMEVEPLLKALKEGAEQRKEVIK